MSSLEQGRLQALGKCGIGAGGVDNGTGFYADLPAGLIAAEADGDQPAKHMAAGFVKEAGATAGAFGLQGSEW